MQFLTAKRGNLFTAAKIEVPGDIGPFETGKRTHADIVKLREQKSIDEVAAADCELWIIDCFFGDSESRRTRTQESVTASPIEFCFRLLRACDQIWQIKTEEIVAFDHIRIPFFNNRGQSLQCRVFRFLDIFWIDNQ